MREWEAEVKRLSTLEEREEFFNHVKHAKTLSEYAQAIAKHIKHTNEDSKTLRVAKWIRPILEGLNMITPMVINLAPVDPRISAILPGAIANVLAVSSKYVTYQEKLERKIAEMASKLDFATYYGDEVFPKSLKLRKALIKLYAVILEFCIGATRLFVSQSGSKRAAILRLARSSWETFEDQFGDVMAEFDRRYDEYQLTVNICRDQVLLKLDRNQQTLRDILKQTSTTIELRSQQDEQNEELQKAKNRIDALSTYSHAPSLILHLNSIDCHAWSVHLS
jgi:hypothetical protein